MRTMASWVAMAGLLALTAGGTRAEDPHLEMIRGLRAQGDADLALAYIQERVPKNLPPELARVIALELARTRVELARDESEEGKRLALFAAARAEFDAFLKANPNDPLAPQARFEIARLTAARGKEAVNRARRLEGEARFKALEDARPAFNDAVMQLRDAAKLLKARLDAATDKAELRDLTQSWLGAQLDEAMNLYLLAQTYGADERKTDEIKKRAEGLTAAGKAFDKLADIDPRHPTCWLARAWLARTLYENDDYPKATTQFELIQAERGPHADDAKRVAAYFRIQMARRQGLTPTQQLTQLQNWLERYRAYQNTPEGCGVRYFIADAQETIARANMGVAYDDKGRPIRVTAEAAQRLKDAERRFRELTEFENDFTERAANRRMPLILAIAIRETPDRDPAKVTTFENGFLLAQLEVAELNEALKTPEAMDNPEKAQQLRKKHFAAAVRALDRSLTLVRPTDPPREVQDARLMQVYAHLIAGNNHEAAVLGEHLARSMTRVGRGAVPALYSLQGYRGVMIEAKTNGGADEQELRTDREHVRRVATWMEATWPNDTPTDTARHTLGSLYFADGDYLKALETYARVTPNYVNMAFLRNEQGIACFNLQRDPKVPAPVKQQWFQRITAELERMPDLGAGADPDAAYAYCMARLQLATLLQQTGKQYDKVERIGKEVLDATQKLTLGDRADEVKYTAQAVMLNGLYGRAFELVKAHRHKDATALFQPVFAALEKSPLPDDEAAQRPRKAFADLLQLALRSSVQEGDIERAQGLLKLLEKVGGSGSAALVAVLKEVQAQVAELKKNDPKLLAETITKFTTFMDTLAKQPNLGKDVKLFLAQGYASLDKPLEAIQLLTTIPAPGAAPKPPAENAPEADRQKYEAARPAYEQDAKTYWFAQLTHVRTLRQAARGEPDAAKRKAMFQQADKMLDEMIGTPQKQGWAFNSLEVRREKIFILEDQELWRPALEGWTAMQRPFVGKFKNPPENDKETRTRAAYFEVRFYMTRLVFKSKLKLKDEKKRDADIKRLAEQLVELERDKRTADFGGDQVKKLYEDWLENEPLIRKAYVEAQGRDLLPGGAAASGN